MSEIDDRNIEINKDGIKLSYLRFLSDGGPGFTTIIYSLYLYSIDSLFVKENVLMHFNDIEFAFLFILLLFLSIPLGLAINASSWVLLGWFNISIEYLFIWIIEIYNMDICELYTSSKTKKLFFWIIKKSFWILSLFFKSTMEKYAFSEIKKFYKITKKNWYCKSCLIKETISTYYPRELVPLDHVEGVLNFIRSLVLLFLIYFTFNPLNLVMVRIFICLILIMSVVFFYYDLSVFCTGYLLCKRAGKEIEDGDIEKIIKYLARTSEKYQVDKTQS